MPFGESYARLDIVTFTLSACACTFLVLRALRPWNTEAWLRRSICAVAALIVIVGAHLADVAGQRESDRMAQMLTGFAPTYAREMETLGIAGIGLDTSADDPAYLRLIDAEKRWLAVNLNANDIYTFCRDAEGNVCLLVDAETDYDRDGRYTGEREARTDIGEVYDEPDPAIEEAFADRVVFAPEPVTDRWGTWVSAYAPIHDEHGTVIGVLGVDYDAEAWIQAISDRRITVLSLIAFLVMVVLAAGGIVMVVRGDLLQRRASERLLEEKTTALLRSNRELERAGAAATAATLAKSEFLANMSHEIRTPLTAILGFADLLLDGDQPEDERQRCVATIRRSGQHLLTLLNDILDLSKIEAGRLELRTVQCALRDLVAEVAQMMSVRAEAKRIGLRVDVADDVPQCLSTDPTRLRQVLVNLVGNAVKFTEHGEVLVQVRAKVALAGPQLEFEVRDTGIGMTAAQLERLFLPFSQVDSSSTRHHGGTGLGLSISRRLVEMLGGVIEVTSEPGRGSRFTIRLPYEPQPAQVDTPPTPSDTTPAPRPAPARLRGRVLVVEDGVDNQMLVSLLLRRAGLEVELANNGQQAIDRLGDADAAPVDLVLMDMMMPVKDGYQATRELRASGLRTPIVALTAHALDSEREICLACGCDAFVTKPIVRDELLTVLDTWIGSPPTG